ncbi:MAG: EAL domain-containing protein [Leptolyngbyaceae cyanobacterium MO_188.B28]|nr:EAL domain-containing protein [Leptolyngbyaceae cyanobacterium MO_188.B28]
MTSSPPQKNILVVDNSPEIVRCLSESLTARGYTVRGANNGEQALQIARSNWPSLILLDILTPEMDGYQVCQALKAQSGANNIPVIFLAALDASFDMARIFSVGGADFITKPFQIEEVIARVNYQLALHSNQSEIKTLNQNLESKVKERTALLVQANCILLEEIRVRRQTEEALKEAHQRLAFHVENSPLAVMEWDSQLCLRRWSARAECVFGWSAEEVIGKSWQTWPFVVESDLETVNAAASRLLRGEESRNICRNQNFRKDGTTVYCEWYNSVLLNEKGQLISILSLVHDVSDRVQAENALKISEERWRRSITDAPFPIMLHSESGAVLQINTVWTELTGYTHTDIPTISDWTELAYGELSNLAKAQIDRLYSIGSRIDEDEVTIQTRFQGERVWSFSSAPLGELENGERLIISMAMDITDRKQMEAQLIHDALHDTLTGLPNRTLLMERLEVALRHIHRDKDYQFAVLFLDLDRFKRVNDSLGHHIGDQFLLKIANLLRQCLRDIDIVARLGGDEFVVLLGEIHGVQEVTSIAQRIQNSLLQPFQLEKHTVASSASIGIVFGNPSYGSGEELLRDADVAMYRAKESGRARYEIFDRQMHFEAIQLLQLESELRQAILQNEFIIHYQPIIYLPTGKLVGFEALIRWRHPSGKLIFPDEFIPIAEENGLILEIGDWVLKSALSQLKAWEEEFGRDISRIEIGVNISAKQLHSNQLIQKIDETLSQIGIGAHRLKLELTESILIENTDSITNVLTSIKGRDIQLSIDDFGKGFSCMSYLNQFPINRLKIDKSFVGNMNSDMGSLAIIKAIIALAKNLNLGVIAEGVEHQSQLASLQEIGCECAQGYYFSKPLAAESVQEWVMKNNRSLLFPD